MPANEDHEGAEWRHDRHFTLTEVLDLTILVGLELVEEDRLHHGKHVVGCEDHTQRSDEREGRVCLERTKECQKFTDEAARARESDRGERRDQERGREPWRDPCDSTELGDCTGMPAFI